MTDQQPIRNWAYNRGMAFPRLPHMMWTVKIYRTEMWKMEECKGSASLDHWRVACWNWSCATGKTVVSVTALEQVIYPLALLHLSNSAVKLFPYCVHNTTDFLIPSISVMRFLMNLNSKLKHTTLLHLSAFFLFLADH